MAKVLSFLGDKNPLLKPIQQVCIKLYFEMGKHLENSNNKKNIISEAIIKIEILMAV